MVSRHLASTHAIAMMRLILVIAYLTMALVAKAQPVTVTPSTYYGASHALLIGINKYPKLPINIQLQYAVADVSELKNLLVKRYGFPRENIKTLTDSEATRANIERALSGLADAKHVKPSDRILIYFSGHGQTVKLPTGTDMGFLIPSDADIELSDNKNAGPFLATCLRMDTIWGYLQSSPAKHTLVVADACYSGLLTKMRGARKRLSLKQLSNLRAMQVITAGDAGQPTMENSNWGHGAFTYKLLEDLRARATTPGTVFTAAELHESLTRSVKALTGAKQTPLLGNYKTDGGDFLFVTTDGPSVPADRVRVEVTTEPPGAKLYIDGIQQKGVLTPAEVELELGTAKSRRIEIATELAGYKEQVQVVELIGGREVTLPAIVMSQQKVSVPIRSTKVNLKDGAEMVHVPSGTFTMGDTDRSDNPPHKVTLSGYYIYKNLVTVAQYRKFCTATGYEMPAAPFWGLKDDHPIVNVTWDDADAYCKWAGGRLPTEAEWEMAARGTDGRKFPWGSTFDNSNLWCSVNGNRASIAPVGRFPTGASPCGALDMAGNVWQWCADWYDAEYCKKSNLTDPSGPSFGKTRVVRSGCWYCSNLVNFRASYRFGADPTERNVGGGFRCASQD